MSAPPSSPSPGIRQRVDLPPVRHSDFIIHFLNTDYHVHQLVRQHHSAFFRALFDSFTPLEQVHVVDFGARPLGERKKRKIDDGKREKEEDSPSQEGSASTASSSSSVLHCDHSPHVRYVQLPAHIGRHGCVEEDVLTFLRHLYFCDLLDCPPLNCPTEALEALSHATPLCLTLAVQSTCWVH
jgi:hypothetical protein